MTPSAIQTLIDNITSTNVNWTGGNEIKPIIEYINANTAIYGLLSVQTYTDLPTYLYGETPIIANVYNDSTALKNGLYMYDGGWNQLFRYINSYDETVGDGITKTFTIEHSLGTSYPSVDLYLISGTYPTLITDYTDIEVTAISNDIITVYFAAGAPNTNSIQVIVRK